MDAFNDWNIVNNNLLAKEEEGATVDLIIQDADNNKRQRFWKALEETSSIHWCYRNTKGTNHDKFCIIDTRSLWHRLFNFMLAASTRNRECLARDVNREVVNKFADEFKHIKRYLSREKELRENFAFWNRWHRILLLAPLPGGPAAVDQCRFRSPTLSCSSFSRESSASSSCWRPPLNI